MTKLLARDLSDLRSVAREILAVSDERVLLFFGDMGAGKTTLVRALCAELGVLEQVSSPTFSIINEYSDGISPVYHFDFYRLKRPAEALDIGIDDYFYSGNYCLVEWPEKIEGLLPDRYLKIVLSVVSENARDFDLSIINS